MKMHRLIISLISIVFLFGCSSNSDSLLFGSQQESLDVPESFLDTEWLLTSIERENGSILTPDQAIKYSLSFDENVFRIGFYCEHRLGNFTFSDSVMNTSQLHDLGIFDCLAPPRPEGEIREILVSFFNNRTIMIRRTDSTLELRSLDNALLNYSACAGADCRSF